MYDYELTALVGQRSQKDPKEYVPLLASLHAISPLSFQRYSIDLHLERPRNALPHVIDAAIEDPQFIQVALDHTTNHNLYRSALRIMRRLLKATRGGDDNDATSFAAPPKADLSSRDGRLLHLYACTLENLGEHLFDSNHHTEAALLFSKCAQPKRALDAYKHVWDWRRVVKAAKELGMEREELQELLLACLSTLQSLGRFSDAAQLSIYCHTPLLIAGPQAQQGGDKNPPRLPSPSALQIRAREWENAVFAATIMNEPMGEFTSIMRAAVLENYEQHCATLSSAIPTFRGYHRRLIAVKERKIRFPVLDLDEGAADDDARSVFSESASVSSASASSASSGGSTTSSRQSRRRAKKMRKRKKRLSGKEGSLHEEEWLHVQMFDMLPAPKLQLEIASLLHAMVEVDLWDEAERLQELFNDFLHVCRAASAILNAPLLGANGQPEPVEESELAAKSVVTRCQWKLALMEVE
eukprot:TRINITY_DN6011_c0_g1_i2.p1 TRINITY_DN6011_c0_g1~~TRINITY_DN6011_c0_g1_i2.p1  ORF type:complete len:512 (+),score=141.13 TRINITY_DN6011_c0_g1_i2:130-1536(+)